MRSFSAALLLPLLAGCATVATPRGSDADISVQTLKEVTQRLSSDAFEGRAPGTQGEVLATELIAQRFQAAGLKPGYEGGWFQPVPLVEITAKDVSPLTFATPRGKQSLAYGEDMVVATYRVQPKVAVTNSDVVFVGYGINAPERNWNDYAGTDVKGKTVVILVNDPDWSKPTLGGTFDGRAMTYYGRWTYKYEEAARQGAAAAIIVHDTEPAAYGWNVVESSWTGPQLVAATANDGADQSQAIGWMQKPQAQKLFAASGQDFAALSAAAARPGFKAVSLNAKASVSFTNTLERKRSKNVVGVLPGKTRPDEVVLYTAHWDHLGRCKPDATGDDICNGALDNASGVAGLIALAEAHAKAGPAERSIAFVAVTAEESGLLGSAYYAAHPVFPLARTVGGINMDGLNIVGPTRNVVEVGGGKSQLSTLLADAARAQGRTVDQEPTPEKGYYYRSDHFSMAKLGVPMLYAESGDDQTVGGKAAGKAAADDYTANRYHQPSDQYDPNWNWAGAVQDLDLYYAMMSKLANSTLMPEWNAGSEFKAIRDKSLATAR